MRLFGGTLSLLESGLQYSSVKNKVISNNLANVDTPNYKAKDVTFKHALMDEQSRLQAKRTHVKHLPFSGGQSAIDVTTRQNVTYNHNGNSVDVDHEMVELAKNQIYYNALVNRVNGKFNSLKTVLKGGN